MKLSAGSGCLLLTLAWAPHQMHAFVPLEMCDCTLIDTTVGFVTTLVDGEEGARGDPRYRVGRVISMEIGQWEVAMIIVLSSIQFSFMPIISSTFCMCVAYNKL